MKSIENTSLLSGTQGNKFIDYNGYVRIRVDKKYVYEHRYIWEQYYGVIPKGCVIHHIDHNKQNNNIENLVLLSKKKHDSITHEDMKNRIKNGFIIRNFNSKSIPKYLLIKLLKQGLSIREIGCKYEMSHNTVKRILNNHNIELKFDSSTLNSPFKNVLIKIILKNKQITITKTLKPGILPINKQSKLNALNKKNNSPVNKITKEFLIEELSKNKSLRQIARENNVSHTTVERRIKKYNIDLR